MDNKIKKVLICIGSIIGGLYILFLILPLILSPIANSYCKAATDAIKTSTGLEAKIEDLSIVTSWNLSAGIKIGEIELSLPRATEPFLSAENIGGKLALSPLLTKKIQLDSLFAEEIEGDIVIKPDGTLLLMDYMPEPQKDNQGGESFSLPLGLKLSNKLPNITIDSYKFGVTDQATSRSYYTEGYDFKIRDFVLNKKVKFSTIGKIIFEDKIVSNYNIKIYNKIMPDVQLDDLIFPKDVIIEDEPQKEQIQATLPFNITEILKSITKNNFTADIITDIKTIGNLKNPKIKGHIKAENLSVAVDGKSLPQSYLDLNFKGNKINIDSIFYTSKDKKEQTQIRGNIITGKKSFVDITGRSNAQFNNIIQLIDSIASTFGINDLNTLSATGGIDADFNIKSDTKKVTSNGYLKILPANIYYDLYNVVINNIVADVNFDNNNVTISNAGFSIMEQPLKLLGTIKEDTTTDLSLTAENLLIKGLIAALGQVAILKDNDINNGTLSINATLKGKLNSIKPELISTINNIDIYNKPSQTKVVLDKTNIKVLYDGKEASGNINIDNLALLNPMAKISIPSSNILIDSKNINLKNSYVLFNNSRIDITGAITNYINDKLNIALNANGNIKSADIASIFPKEFSSLLSYKGQMPLSITINGNSRVQNIKINLDADPNNYIAIIDLDSLKGQKTKIHSNIEIIGESLNFSNTGISNNKTTIAKLSGGITQLYTKQKLNLNIAVPNSVSFPIWGVPNSNITTNGTVSIVGRLADPQLRGTVNLMDISMKDFLFEIKDLVADLSGSILNGTATARQFKVGGIVATDISGDFALKDYSKFYLTDLKGKAFDGELIGKISYGIYDSKIGVELKGTGLNSTKAVEGAVGIKNALTGNLDFNTKLNMQGITDKEIIQSMKGIIDFSIGNGKFISIGRIENLLTAQNVSSNSILKSAISALSSLSIIQEADKYDFIKGQINLSNGTANLTKIDVAGPLMAYHVHGNYNILPNTANLTILGRLDSKVVAVLGPLGELSAEKLLSYIPKFGSLTANIINQMTTDPSNENTTLIPTLSNGSTTYKDFKVSFNGPVTSASSMKSFKWLTKCDTSEIDIKEEFQKATEVVKTNINQKIEDVKNIKNTFKQIKSDIQTTKQNNQQNPENLKNLFKNVIKNSQQKMPTSETTP